MLYDTITYSEFCDNLASYIARTGKGKRKTLIVTRRHGRPLLVKHQNGREVVIKELDETEYLLSSPANAKILREALREPRRNYKRYESVDAIKKDLGIK